MPQGKAQAALYRPMQLKKERSMWYILLMVLIGVPGMVVNILALLERYHKRQSKERR